MKRSGLRFRHQELILMAILVLMGFVHLSEQAVDSHVTSDDDDIEQSARIVAARGRRSVSPNFWKRFDGSEFWKRFQPDDRRSSPFWKRGPPEAGRPTFWKRYSAPFWKRFELTDADLGDLQTLEDLEDAEREGLVKKDDQALITKQQRRGKQSQRRPEFNPTGW